MRGRIKAAAAALRSAIAGSVIVSVVETVVVGQLFSRFNVAQRNDPHLPSDLIGFAVRFAAMIDERCNAIAIDDALAAVEPEQVSVLKVVVKIVGLLVAEGRADVFDDERALADALGGVAPERVDGGFADD